jgi:hypothetical protein
MTTISLIKNIMEAQQVLKQKGNLLFKVAFLF